MAISLTISANGLFDDFSLLGCLTTGSDCFSGNQITANFQIPAANLHSANVAAIELDQPHPLDLLEDDGTTDIHGSIATSYTPEPRSAELWGAILAVLGVVATRSRLRKSHQESKVS